MMEVNIIPRGTSTPTPMDDFEGESFTNTNQEALENKTIRTYKRVKEQGNTNIFTLPKKTAKPTITPTTTISTHNYFAPLTVTNTTTTTTASTSKAGTSGTQPQTTPRPTPTPTPPAVVIEKKGTSSKLLLTLRSTLRSEYTATYNTQGLRVQCTTQEDYLTLQQLLTTTKLQFFTYLSSKQNYVKVIMRGLPPNIAEEEIFEELQSKHLPMISVRQLRKTQIDPDTAIRSKIPLPVWLITLRNEAGAKENIHQLKGILNLSIKIEDYEGSATPMQCFRCQRFGHKAQGCNLQAKCVKCAGDHNTRECTKDPISPATCSNCKGSHPANYRQCPRYIAYSKPFHSQTQPTPVPQQNQANFPKLRPTKGPIPNFRQESSPEPVTNTITDLKEFIEMIKAFNIKQCLAKLKQTINEVAKQPDIISKCLSFVTGICSIFDDGTH